MTITPYAMMRYMEMDKDDVGCGSVFGLRPECSLQDINRVVKNNTEGENIHNKLELIIPNIRITYSDNIYFRGCSSMNHNNAR